jgi:hypothetical protein
MKCDLKYPVATSSKKNWQLMWNRRRPWNGAWLRETCFAFDKLQECENKILIQTFYSKNNKAYNQFGLQHKGELCHSNHLDVATLLLGLRHLWAYIILTRWRRRIRTLYLAIHSLKSFHSFNKPVQVQTALVLYKVSCNRNVWRSRGIASTHSSLSTIRRLDVSFMPQPFHSPWKKPR